MWAQTERVRRYGSGTSETHEGVYIIIAFSLSLRNYNLHIVEAAQQFKCLPVKHNLFWFDFFENLSRKRVYLYVTVDDTELIILLAFNLILIFQILPALKPDRLRVSRFQTVSSGTAFY